MITHRRKIIRYFWNFFQRTVQTVLNFHTVVFFCARSAFLRASPPQWPVHEQHARGPPLGVHLVPGRPGADLSAHHPDPRVQKNPPPVCVWSESLCELSRSSAVLLWIGSAFSLVPGFGPVPMQNTAESLNLKVYYEGSFLTKKVEKNRPERKFKNNQIGGLIIRSN